ncbi:MAG: ABC transporter substrate-binding protein, partial [Gammaproteobacteria bacterium]|nr:ABC transporter substrate-binding protein [Gammaproteobacteria bacterium]
GNLDAAIIWGPIAGFFAKQVSNSEVAVVPLASEPGIQFDFAISAGVRYGDSERKQLLEDLISRTATQMQEVLTNYNVPLLNLDEARWPDDDD